MIPEKGIKRKTEREKGPLLDAGRRRQRLYFAVIAAPKVPDACINVEKNGRWYEEISKGDERWERERKTRRGRQEKKKPAKRVARLVARGSNCARVINLKVRFSRERTGGERKREER